MVELHSLAEAYNYIKRDKYLVTDQAWVLDQRRKYNPGDISEKTGLEKQPDGTWKEPKTDGDKKEWKVPKSLGAKAVEFTAKVDISVRKGKNKYYTLKAGSTITNIETIARGHGIKRINYLINNYKKQNDQFTDATDWTKKKGTGKVVDKKGFELNAELHWYECQGLGKKDFKVKKWLDEK